MSVSMSGPAGRAGVHPYAHGAAALGLAAAGAAAVLVAVTTLDPEDRPWVLFVLGMGQVWVFLLARSLPWGYRVASSLALLWVFAAAFVPGLLRATPLGYGAAVGLAVVGSLPLWVLAVVRLRATRRELTGEAHPE